MEFVNPETGELYAPPLRSGYNYDRDLVSLATALVCPEPTLTQQQFAEDADINTIVRRFGITGRLPENVRVPTYGDFTYTGDYREALHAIQLADDSFMAMPAEVRATFQNDPALFVDFCSNPDNLPRMRELGLAVPEPASSVSPTALPSALQAPPAPGPIPGKPEAS